MKTKFILIVLLCCSHAFSQELIVIGSSPLQWRSQYYNAFQNAITKNEVAAQLRYSAWAGTTDFVTVAVGFDIIMATDPYSPYQQQDGLNRQFLCEVDLDKPNNEIALYNEPSWVPGQSKQLKFRYVANAKSSNSQWALGFSGFGINIGITGNPNQALPPLSGYKLFTMTKPADPCASVACPTGQHCENGNCVPDIGSGGTGGGGTGGGGTGDPCDNVNCPAWEECIGGVCYSECDIFPCDPGYECEFGECVLVTTEVCWPGAPTWPECCNWAKGWVPECTNVPESLISFARIGLAGGTLVWDRNGNGLSGPTELFHGIGDGHGGSFTNPIDGLFLLDNVRFGGNGDGAISPKDTIWRQLYVLYDRGTYDKVAYVSLEDLGLEAIFTEDLEVY